MNYIDNCYEFYLFLVGSRSRNECQGLPTVLNTLIRFTSLLNLTTAASLLKNY